MNRPLVRITFRRDDDTPDSLTVSRIQADRIKRLAQNKGLPLEAVMNVIAGRVSAALNTFLKASGV